MPHIQIDYSPNLEGRLDIQSLCDALCASAAKTGIFPVAGLRVRATAASYYAIADGDPGHAFLDISVRLRAGRTHESKVQATETLFATAERHCADLLAGMPFLLSIEMRDIDPDLSRKVSSIRNYLPEDLH